MISSKKSRIGAVALLVPVLSMTVGPVFAADAVAQSVPATVQTTQVAQLGVDQPVPLQEAEMGEVKGKFWGLYLLGVAGAGYLIYRGVSGKGLPGSPRRS